MSEKGGLKMKIQGPNPLINTYRQQQQKFKTNKNEQFKDQIKISTEAKKLQENNQIDIERSKYVNEIKQLVQSGEYKVEHDKTAQKMIDFWTKSI